MNKCKHFIELLSSYADGELSGAEKRETEAHLMSCSNCSKLLNLYQSISKAGADSAAPVPKSLVTNVMERVNNSGTRFNSSSNSHKRNRSLVTRYAPIAACLVILLLATPFVLPMLLNQNNIVPLSAPEAADAPQMAAADIAPAPAPEADDAPPAEQEEFYYEFEERTVEFDDAGTWGYHYGIRIYLENDTPIAEEDAVAIDEDALTPYFTVLTIFGDLPQVLGQFIPVESEDEDAYYVLYLVSRETAQMIIEHAEDDSSIVFSPIDEDGEYALVIHLP